MIAEPLIQTSQKPVNRSLVARLRSPRTWSQLLTLIALVIGSIIMVMPFLWMISSSLKAETRVFEFPPTLIPDPIMFENYTEALIYKPFDVYLRNTMIIVALNEIAILLSASYCAYGFARIRFPGRNFWFIVVLGTMMLPSVVTMIPTFVIFSRLKWLDTFLPLTVPYLFGGEAFNIFLLRQFFRTIPEELADAARMDGASEHRIWWSLFMPLAKPALTTVAIFTFLNAWNDFMGPLLYLNSPEKFTVSLGLATFHSVMRTRWDLLMAATTAMTLPVVFIFFAGQRYFVKGVVLTGLKG
jgi:ABC-type glycerol-3-phosphate transport system permease component